MHNSLPYPKVTYIDGDFNNISWEYYLGEFQNESLDLYEAFADIIRYGFIYHYETEEQDTEYHSHGHSFEDVIHALYYFPEHFHIPEDSLHEYSAQELKYLKRLQSYLLFIGLKNIQPCETEEEMDIQKKNRANNEKALKYSQYSFYEPEETRLNNILKGKYCYFIKPEWKDNKDEYLKEKYLLINSEQEIIGEINITDVQIMSIDELKEDMVDYSKEGTFTNYINKLKQEFTYHGLEKKIVYLKYDINML